MKRKIDWEKIKIEYATSDINLKDLAIKHNIQHRIMNDKSSELGFVNARKVYRSNVLKDALKKTTSRDGDALADELAALNKAKSTVIRILDDEEQFNRWLVEEVSADGSRETVEKVFDKADSRALKDMVSSLKMIEELTRRMNGLLTVGEQAKIEMEREKLELEKEKWQAQKKAMEEEAKAGKEVVVRFASADAEEYAE